MVLVVNRACPTTGCPGTLPCKDHGTKRQKLDERRGTSHERGYGARWRRARALFLAAHPLCERCAMGAAPYVRVDGGAWQGSGRRHAAAVVVDHVKPHPGQPGLFWYLDNWWGLCRHHDDAKRARENGLTPCTQHGIAYRIIRGEAICLDCGRRA